MRTPWARNYQEILHVLKPTVLLEFGTHYGGSVLYFADVMKAVHSKGTPYSILTVDVNPSYIDPQASSSHQPLFPMPAMAFEYRRWHSAPTGCVSQPRA